MAYADYPPKGMVFMPGSFQSYYCNRIVPDENGIVSLGNMNLDTDYGERDGGIYGWPHGKIQVITRESVITREDWNKRVMAKKIEIRLGCGTILKLVNNGDRFDLPNAEKYKFTGNETLIAEFDKIWRGYDQLWVEILLEAYI